MPYIVDKIIKNIKHYFQKVKAVQVRLHLREKIKMAKGEFKLICVKEQHKLMIGYAHLKMPKQFSKVDMIL